MKANTDYNLIIIRYLDGTATPDEKYMLLNWLKESDQHKAVFTEVRELWLVTDKSLDLETEEALRLLHERIFRNVVRGDQSLVSLVKGDLQIPVKETRGSDPEIGYGLSKILTTKAKRTFATVKPKYITLLKYTAVILLLIITGVISYHVSRLEPEMVVMNRVITGEDKGMFVLPDSTVVWLNKHSSLEYPDLFDKTRNVKLTGSAYFEVKKGDKVPFIVEAGELNIRVAGTRFIVNNYACRSSIQTILVSGKVYINSPYMTKEAELFPGEFFSYNTGTRMITSKMVDTGNYLSWLNRQLVLDNRSFRDVITNMESWYGIDILYPRDFAKDVNMSFTIRDESVEEIMKTMQLITPIDYKWEDDKLHLFPAKRE